MIKVSIIGASGYAGAELTRLLMMHEDVEIINLCSKSYANMKFGELYPGHIAGDYTLSDIDIEKIGNESDVIFTALPHGVSSKTVLKLSKYNKKIIDLSGDYRYDDENVYEKNYNIVHPSPELMKKAVYGLSEVYKDKIAKADIVANPGCYTTCAILSLRPLIKNKLIDESSIIIDAKSGVTGAGRKATQGLHFCETQENFKAYKVAVHRHTSEIEQELSKVSDDDIKLSFTPHLLPVKRGILETIYMALNPNCSEKEIERAFKTAYKDECFIKVLTNGEIPELKSVVGSNSLHIGYVIDKRLHRLIIVSVLDNLIKGAAGQAVQNMNIMYGLTQDKGLNKGGWYL